MSYYADGTLTELGIMVGWLSETVPFNKGASDSEFLEKLLKLYAHRTNQTRGFHLCPFCTAPEPGIPLDLEGRQIKLGSAEVHVRMTSGRTFVSPDLIYHYIVAHAYQPPRAFIEVVRVSS